MCMQRVANSSRDADRQSMHSGLVETRLYCVHKTIRRATTVVPCSQCVHTALLVLLSVLSVPTTTAV